MGGGWESLRPLNALPVLTWPECGGLPCGWRAQRRDGAVATGWRARGGPACCAQGLRCFMTREAQVMLDAGRGRTPVCRDRLPCSRPGGRSGGCGGDPGHEAGPELIIKSNNGRCPCFLHPVDPPIQTPLGSTGRESGDAEGSPDCCPRGCGTTGFATKTDSGGERGVWAEVPVVFLCPGRVADVTPVLMLLSPES